MWEERGTVENDFRVRVCICRRFGFGRFIYLYALQHTSVDQHIRLYNQGASWAGESAYYIPLLYQGFRTDYSIALNLIPTAFLESCLRLPTTSSFVEPSSSGRSTHKCVRAQ